MQEPGFDPQPCIKPGVVMHTYNSRKQEDQEIRAIFICLVSARSAWYRRLLKNKTSQKQNQGKKKILDIKTYRTNDSSKIATES